jgi:hypothetical protein
MSNPFWFLKFELENTIINFPESNQNKLQFENNKINIKRDQRWRDLKDVSLFFKLNIIKENNILINQLEIEMN